MNLLLSPRVSLSSQQEILSCRLPLDHHDAAGRAWVVVWVSDRDVVAPLRNRDQTVGAVPERGRAASHRTRRLHLSPATGRPVVSVTVPCRVPVLPT